MSLLYDPEVIPEPHESSIDCEPLHSELEVV